MEVEPSGVMCEKKRVYIRMRAASWVREGFW